ncbi:MAG: ARMT1-like domain-containing protein [Desulfonauticus sp.]|nr:ARMT1-like domain-containing protein [Desulfonauticus sp.]
MHTYLDCIPCFLRQALKASRLAAPGQEEIHKKIILKFCNLVPKFDLSLSPPALAGKIYEHINKLTGQNDPFKAYKQKVNQKALSLLPQLKEMLKKHSDPLKTALHISIIGNYIDAGIDLTFDWEKALHQEENTLNQDTINFFLQQLENHSQIMILGDNAGEIVLDKLLVEELVKLSKKVIYVVRERPIINDATIEDARQVGMTELCTVISSGVNTPGTVLEACSKEFKEKLNKTPIILSKGQGNFEALLDQKNNVFFAFKVKCPVVEQITGKKIGESVFMYK